ncbi:hypothetical protein C8Q77DRAFT_606708 [Trametes polyzona]|nr:hypothetical protein C8Q77DRAFT_606708 [Trametes polyzona]
MTLSSTSVLPCHASSTTARPRSFSSPRYPTHFRLPSHDPYRHARLLPLFLARVSASLFAFCPWLPSSTRPRTSFGSDFEVWTYRRCIHPVIPLFLPSRARVRVVRTSIPLRTLLSTPYSHTPARIEAPPLPLPCRSARFVVAFYHISPPFLLSSPLRPASALSFLCPFLTTRPAPPVSFRLVSPRLGSDSYLPSFSLSLGPSLAPHRICISGHLMYARLSGP